MCLQLHVPEYPVVREIEELWRSSHLGENDWEDEVAQIEKELEACAPQEKAMDISEDEGCGDEDVESDNEIFKIIDSSQVQVKPLDLSAKDKEAMAQRDDMVNLKKIGD